VVRVTRWHTHCDQVRFENLDVDAPFLKPPPAQKHGIVASPMTRQHRMLLDDRGGDPFTIILFSVLKT
jgi:hypothetical protein